MLNRRTAIAQAIVLGLLLVSCTGGNDACDGIPEAFSGRADDAFLVVNRTGKTVFIEDKKRVLFKLFRDGEMLDHHGQMYRPCGGCWCDSCESCEQDCQETHVPAEVVAVPPEGTFGFTWENRVHRYIEGGCTACVDAGAVDCVPDCLTNETLPAGPVEFEAVFSSNCDADALAEDLPAKVTFDHPAGAQIVIELSE